MIKTVLSAKQVRYFHNHCTLVTTKEEVDNQLLWSAISKDPVKIKYLNHLGEERIATFKAFSEELDAFLSAITLGIRI